MEIDGQVLVSAAGAVGLVLFGKYMDRWLTFRPKVITYLGHASAFTLRGNPPGTIHTHAIVLVNAGRAAANNVRVGHHIFPENYQLSPPVPHTVEGLPGAPAEIVLSKLVPGEQVTISYLYFPPLVWSQIHNYTKSDEGFAKTINVFPTQQLLPWTRRALLALVCVGGLTVAYFVFWLVQLGRALLAAP